MYALYVMKTDIYCLSVCVISVSNMPALQTVLLYVCGIDCIDIQKFVMK